MELPLYNTAELVGVIDRVQSITPYWLDLYFPRVMTFETEQILFDEIDVENRQLAPFVAPNVQGRVMRDRGFTTKAFRPAYVKPKHVVNPQKAFSRLAGEGLNGTLTPAARWDAAIARNMQMEKDSITNRLEWMAAQAMLYGAVIVEGPDYPKVTVDFGRDPSLSVTLNGADRWDQPNAQPLEDIEDWMTRVQRKSGRTVTRVTMGVDAWAAFRKKLRTDDFEKAFRVVAGSQDKGTQNIQLGLGNAERTQYKGTLNNGLEVWTYSEVFVDDDGTEVPLMDSRDVHLGGPAVQGVQCYGAIMDARAGLKAMQMFPKMWEEQDPSVVYTMTQSAPLMVPTRENVSFRARVVSA